MQRTETKHSGRWIFYFVFLASMLFSAVYLAINRGRGLEKFIFDRGTNVFGDFINNLHYPTHEGGPYYDGIWASFPPLAYTFYYLFNVAFTRAKYPFELLSYTVITSFTCLLMYFAIEKLVNDRIKRTVRRSEPLALSACLLLSGTSVYTIERGNSVLNVMVMLLWAFAFRNSRQFWKRELSLILIAVAANFKLYPAVFGLIYLFEKRWKESIRLLIYGIVLFVVPFAWFGGLDGFKQFLINQSLIHSLLQDRYLTSIPSVMAFLAAEFGWDGQQAVQIGKWLAMALALLLAVCFVLEKRLWSRTLLLCSFFTLVPGWCAEYMAIYMALPFILCYCDAPGQRWFPLYITLFAGVFVLLPFGVPFQVHAALSWNTLVSFASIYLLTLVSCADALTGAVSCQK